VMSLRGRAFERQKRAREYAERMGRLSERPIDPPPRKVRAVVGPPDPILLALALLAGGDRGR